MKSFVLSIFDISLCFLSKSVGGNTQVRSVVLTVGKYYLRIEIADGRKQCKDIEFIDIVRLGKMQF